MEIINGVFFHATGASFAALCYTPQKAVKRWSWQSYWLVQAFFCWLLLPVLGAIITIPQLTQVLQEAPKDAMLKSFLLGIAYGVGGTAFGMAIRHIGFSLTYAISIGISCVLGTLLPPLVRGNLNELLQRTGADFIMMGIGLGLLGIILCGVAGRFKEKGLQKQDSAASGFSLSKGLPLCLLAGILSAVYGFAIDLGQPIADIAARHGAGGFQGNVVYIFSNSGAFLSTLLYCLYLHKKQHTFGEYSATQNNLPTSQITANFVLSALTGLLWYGQFFFYGLGHVRMGAYKFSSWAIHMIMLVLFSSFAGIVMKEWKRCSSRTIRLLVAALLVLVTAVLVLTYGNYLGESAN